MNQRDGVYQAVISVVGEPEQGKEVRLTKEQRGEVHQRLIADFLEGNIQFDGDAKTPEVFKKYVPGLVNNWLRKDKRLNGGQKYVPKNPGIRAGSGDETMKAMKTLLTITADQSAKNAIQAEIDKRKVELDAKKRPTINVSALPESLRHLAPVNSGGGNDTTH